MPNRSYIIDSPREILKELDAGRIECTSYRVMESDGSHNRLNRGSNPLQAVPLYDSCFQSVLKQCLICFWDDASRVKAWKCPASFLLTRSSPTQ